MSGNRPFRVALTGLLVLAAVVLASCAPTLMSVETGPRAWVGGPPDGSEVPLGAVSVMCHGYAGAGVTHLELWVNGAFANRAANTSPGSEYFTASMDFETTGPGSYVVHCWTYGDDGGTAQSEPVTLRITGEEPTPTTGEEEIPTATPTSTEAPPTATVPPPTGTPVPPTSTSIPPTSTRIPPTSTPPPPTSTREPPRITSFEVTASQITLGQCVTFSYVVAGSPDAIFFNGEGVGGPSGSVERCPNATREFELTAEVGGQVVDRATLTVVVVPGDTEGPDIERWAVSPTLIYWDEYDSCTPNQVTINAYNVTDPSGVSGVKVVYRMNGGTLQSVGMTQVQTGMWSATIGPNDLERSLDPPVGMKAGAQNSLECHVEAIDGAGNHSQTQVRTVTVQYRSCRVM
jgi:hypothetical protein